MKIRECRREDLQHLAKLFVEGFNQAPWNESWEYERAYKRLEMVMDTPRFIGLVIEEGEEILGGALGNLEYWYEGNHYQIKEFFVDIHVQGKGLGKTLLSELQKELEKHDISAQELLTLNVEKTIGFYEKMGYTVNKEIICMCK